MKLDKLSEQLEYNIEKRIQEEFNAFKESMYAGKSLEERKELDQFFTPPEITIPLLESLLDSYAEDDKTFANKDILDPTSGTGNLLMACIIAGADPTRVYGNDYDGIMVKKCLERLNKYCSEHELASVPTNHIHQGNALQKKCLTNFDDRPEESYLTGKSHYQIKYIDDLDYAQSDMSWVNENSAAKIRAEQKAEAKKTAVRKAEGPKPVKIETPDIFGGF